jgi:DNA modification methylase
MALLALASTLTRNDEEKFIANPKRGKLERKGLHGWHPYYAGYSEAFVNSVLESLDLKGTPLVLDPWSGSGTTGMVACRRGIRSIGIEINPAMVIFSTAKFALNFSTRPSIEKRLEKVITKAIALSESEALQDSLRDILSPSAARYVGATFNSIRTIRAASPDLRIPGSSALSREFEKKEPLFALFEAALYRFVRELAGIRRASNPTWLKSSEKRRTTSEANFYQEYRNIVSNMLDDLENTDRSGVNSSFSAPIIIEGDSRSLPIKTETIDAIVTSPPYLTRIDYAMSTSPELLLIGGGAYLRRMREISIGAPVIVEKNFTSKKEWGFKCLALLKQVGAHASKASRSYYLPFMHRYFDDIYKSNLELSRVLKKKGKMFVVVQSSYFKEIEIPLGEIFLEMFKGMEGIKKTSIVRREEVKNHLAHVNTISSQYKANKIYFEDVVLVEK